MNHDMPIVGTTEASEHTQRRQGGEKVDSRHVGGSHDFPICVRDLNTGRDGAWPKVLAASSLVVDARKNVELVASDVCVH